jgi:hypothetical protein
MLRIFRLNFVLKKPNKVNRCRRLLPCHEHEHLQQTETHSAVSTHFITTTTTNKLPNEKPGTGNLQTRNTGRRS